MGDHCDICGYVGQLYVTAELISVAVVILNYVCARRCLIHLLSVYISVCQYVNLCVSVCVCGVCVCVSVCVSVCV